MNNIDSSSLMPDLFSIFGSLVLVLCLLGIVLFVLKKVQMTNSVTNGKRQIQILEVVPANNKQKIMLLKVGEQQFLVGVSGQNMNQLGHWNTSSNIPTSLKQKQSNQFNNKNCDNSAVSESFSKSTDESKLEKNKTNTIVCDPEPVIQTSSFDTELTKFADVSAIKQTENLLNFAKKIRGSLNQSINSTQRAQ